MGTLLAILLVTQADQSSPSLAFAWPPHPKPTLRLDRPVYLREQSQICASDLKFYSAKKPAHASHNHSTDYSDHHGIRFVRGFESDSNYQDHGDQSSSDELDLHQSGQHPHSPFGVEEDEDSAELFYKNHASDPHRLNAQEPTRSSSPMRPNYLGFEPDAWADMLTPRVHGCQDLFSDTPTRMASGRKLELVIDSLAIIAHPVLVNQKPTEINAERSMERGRTRTRSGENEIPPPLSDSSSKLPSSPAPFLHTATPSSKPTEPSQPRHSSADRPLSTHDGLDLSTLDLNDTFSSSSSPVKPPVPAPISQLTRMMTPSTKSIEHSSSSTCNQIFLQPQSSASIRSSSSPSPVALPARFKIKPIYQPITYSPMGGFPLAPTVMVDDLPQVDETISIPSPQLAPLQSFTLALIIDTPPASHLSQHLEVYYKDVVLKLTAALKHLERKSSYLTREVQEMMRKLSEQRNSDSSRSISQSKPLGIAEKMKFLEERFDLPRALARTFNDLKTLGSSSITLDHQLDLDLLLHRELLDSNTVSDNWLSTNSLKSPFFQAGEQDQFAHLESWKSLLLLEDPQLLVEQTAPESLLRDFIAIIKPALTLSEYKFLLDTDSNTIAEMTDHLLYWRKAKITDMITLRSSYQLTCPLQNIQSNPSSNTLLIPTLQHEFSATFPNLPNLVMILSLISRRSRQPFMNILPLLDPSLDKSESMAVLVWLLKRDLLVRERTHVRIKIDRHTKLKVALLEREKKRDHKGSDDECIDEQSSLSPGSHSQNESHQAHKQGQISSSLSSDRQFKSTSGSSLKKTTNHIQLQQQPVMSDQAFASAVPSSSAPHYLNRPASSYRGSHLQPRSINSVISSDELSRDPRQRQQSVQSDFSNISENHPHPHHPAEFDDPSTDRLIFSTHKDSDLGDSIIGEPGQATALEQKWLDEICSDKTDFQMQSFNCAFRYFNGRYPLEEIISRSSLSKKALNEVLIEFKANLILLIHP